MEIGCPIIFYTSSLLSEFLWGEASPFMEKYHCQANFSDNTVKADKDKLCSHTTPGANQCHTSAHAPGLSKLSSLLNK